MLHRLARLLSCALALAVLAAPSARAAEVSPHWLRNPAISPDGTTVVFDHGGDLYRVPIEGGRAIPLTLEDAWDGHATWSPDGQWLAFASDRFGGSDVFVMPSEGGVATRLTFHSSNDIPSAFSADGKEIYFSSARLDDPRNSQFPSGGLSEFYAVSVEGGTPRQVFTTAALQATPDRRGQRLLYEEVKGYEDPLRKHHTSAIARDLWMADLRAGTHTRITDFAGEDREPRWASDDAFYFLSERNGDMNVFRQELRAGATAEQLTRFEHHPVRGLSASTAGTLVFSWHGDLYRLQPGSEPERIAVTIAIDRQEPEITMEEMRRGISEFAVSPDGQEVAFVTRGEVFVTSVDFQTTRRITDTPEQERSISFSPDGRSLLYAGERDGSWNVYASEIADPEEEWFFAATRITEKVIAATDKEEFQPRFSPDGKKVAYLVERVVLTVKDLESGSTKVVLPGEYAYSYSDGDQGFEWAPDGEWLAVQFLSRGRYYGDAIGLVKADGSEGPIDITNSGYANWSPRFAMKGGLLLWSTERFGERAHGSWGGESDVVGSFLDRKTWDAFHLTKEERQLAEGRKKKEKGGKNGGEEKGDAKKEEDAADEEEKPVVIDFDGIEERTMRFTIHSSDLGGFAMTPDGRALIYLASFEKGYDLWIHDFVEESTKLATKLGAERASMELVDEGKAVFVLADGQLQKIGIKTGDDGTEAGKTERISMSPEMNVRPAQERAYLLDHVWRQVKQKFYDPELHGVDWEFYRAQYEPKLAGITNNRDFAELLSELLGELNASHTGGRYFGRPDNAESTPALGVFFDNTYRGPGVRIAEILPRGPLAEEDLGIEPGMVIKAVDGVELTARTNLWALLNNKQDERVRLTFDPAKGDDFDRVVMPISTGEEYQLRYDRWVKQRREQVRELSGGRIGYVHVRGMNDSSFRTTYSEVLGRNYDTDAVIIDTRYNGGGWLHDDLVVLLGGKRYVDFMPRNQAVPGQRFFGEPGKRWWKPSAVVMSEGNYSDAHFFPWAYDELDMGPTIGMPVPGTATAVWWERLHTGDLVFGIPQVGMVDLEDGGYLENRQLEPDHRVEITPEQAARGEDPQIETAVKVLMEMVGPKK